MGARRAVAGLAVVALLAGNGPLVRTDAGAVRGEALTGHAAAFRGIPFAAPPVGPLRWRNAVRAKPWRGVRNANVFGPACPQKPEGKRPALVQSEDCLNLNLITPDLHALHLPVLVVIHGGAYAFGSNRSVTDQGLTPLLRRGVVLVTPNYRVGRLGFFAHPALTAEAGYGTGNFWLSDQVLALDWVRRNVARFGGDPGNVTILGCSAGGSSVNALMVTPAARGLFAKASAHSGGGLFNANRPLAEAEKQGEAFARRAGAETLAQLRALTPAQVLAADPGPPDFGAIIDGHWLAEPLSVAFAHGRQAHVPYLVGSTSNEASVFGLMGFDAAALRARFGIDVPAMRSLYPGPIADAELLRRVQTDFLFTSAALGMAGLASRSAPAWAYHFGYIPSADRGHVAGAPHCADMPYIVGPQPDQSAASRALAAEEQGYLYNFMRRGDPNGAGLARWPGVVSGRIDPRIFAARAAPPPPLSRPAIAAWYARWQHLTGIAIDP